uniref:Uncharacterized protein n=1 Tax=Candidatus Kentrum sp. FM TaxID=2126340 RepID=A0A450W164_9GAMM|nr:MAG: hypothetical protein BECKFM1743A_GA0114220_101594 [Candidatus Kentron sp. FM]VFJ56413.1 MAG: hypothetical protein BECKFM1743C_GA0114222_101764 [Candidatus Kentron sp. FM]VFK10827.1 MAG: hypothetical protein BECKFM1743B_GA0114221_101564 [Candidatus Kentron sp. FM]
MKEHISQDKEVVLRIDPSIVRRLDMGSRSSNDEEGAYLFVGGNTAFPGGRGSCRAEEDSNDWTLSEMLRQAFRIDRMRCTPLDFQ